MKNGNRPEEPTRNLFIFDSEPSSLRLVMFATDNALFHLSESKFDLWMGRFRCLQESSDNCTCSEEKEWFDQDLRILLNGP